MVQRPCPDLRGGCAAMRIPTVTEAGSTTVPGSSRFINEAATPVDVGAADGRFSWKRLERMTEILWPRASIRHPWPDQRFAVKHPR